jgi:nucleolysin TIA-1/TIAR
VDYFDHRSAAAALLTLNGRQMFGQPIKVNWAYVSGQREDTTGYLQSLVSFVYAMNDG